MTFALIFIAIRYSKVCIGCLEPIPTFVPEDIGIVVTNFADTNNLVDQQQEIKIVSGFARNLETELNKAGAALHLNFRVRGPENIQPIKADAGKTPEELAGQLADVLTADIVVYGTYVYNEPFHRVELSPEFYISPRQFWDSLEITGSERLGSPLPISNFDAGNERDPLIQRTRAIALIIQGIAKYTVQDYAAALPYFTSVSSEPGWSNEKGSEVLNILLGNTHLKLAQEAALNCQTTTVSTQRQQILDQIRDAVTEYTTAQGLTEGDYSRPFVGLASAYVLWSLWGLDSQLDGCDPLQPDVNLLVQAADFLGKAEQASEQPNIVGVGLREDFTKAQVLFWRWYGNDPNFSEEDFAAFPNLIKRIITAYDNGTQPELFLLAIEARTLRATDYLLQGQYFEAIDDYNAILGTENLPPDRRVFVTAWRAYCYEMLGNFPTAAAAYDEARQLAAALGNQDDAAKYQGTRDAVLATMTAEMP